MPIGGANFANAATFGKRIEFKASMECSLSWWHKNRPEDVQSLHASCPEPRMTAAM